MKYYFKSNGQEYLIKLNIQTGKYEIYNSYLTLIDEGHTLFQVTELNAPQYCNSITSEFIKAREPKRIRLTGRFVDVPIETEEEIEEF